MKNKDMVNQFHHNNDGLTLIELLVSILLLTIIVGAFLSAFGVSTKNNITSGQVVDAGYATQNVMEEIINIVNNDTSIAVEDLAKMIADNPDQLESEIDDSIPSKLVTRYTAITESNGYTIKIELTENAYESEDLVKIWIETVGSPSGSEASLQNIITINSSED